jgi:hypothetical protein
MVNPQPLNLDTSDHNRTTQIRIQIDVPQKFHQEPVVFNLAAHYQLKVNILAAILGKNAIGDGWFDLELRGKSKDIEGAIAYLDRLGIQARREPDREPDGW